MNNPLIITLSWLNNNNSNNKILKDIKELRLILKILPKIVCKIISNNNNLWLNLKTLNLLIKYIKSKIVAVRIIITFLYNKNKLWCILDKIVAKINIKH